MSVAIYRLTHDDQPAPPAAVVPTDALQLLDVRAVSRLLGISIKSVWTWSSCGRLPAPIKLGSMTTRWKRTALEQWLKEREDRNV